MEQRERYLSVLTQFLAQKFIFHEVGVAEVKVKLVPQLHHYHSLLLIRSTVYKLEKDELEGNSGAHLLERAAAEAPEIAESLPGVLLIAANDG